MDKYTGDISKLEALPDRPTTAANGTEFVVVERNGMSKVWKGDIVTLCHNDGTTNPFFLHPSYPSRIAISLPCLALLPKKNKEAEQKHTIQWEGRTIELPAKFMVVKDPREDGIENIKIGDTVKIIETSHTLLKFKCSQGWYWWPEYIELIEETKAQPAKSEASWLTLDIKYPAKFRFVKNPKDIGISRFSLGDIITVNKPPKNGYVHDIVASYPYTVRVDFLEPVSETKEAELSDDAPTDDEPYLECVNGIARVGDYVTLGACCYGRKIIELDVKSQSVKLTIIGFYPVDIARFVKVTEGSLTSEQSAEARRSIENASGTERGKIKKGSDPILRSYNPGAIIMDDGVTPEYQNKPKTKGKLMKESHELAGELFETPVYKMNVSDKDRVVNPYNYIQTYGLQPGFNPPLNAWGLWSEQKTKYKQIIKKPLTKKIMSIISKLTRTEDQKALLHFGLIYEDGTLTDKGQDEWNAYVWSTGTTDKADFTAKIIEAYKEETKKKCK